MNDSLLEQVVAVLSAASSKKPWMTASYIARKIGNPVNGERIEQALLAHCRNAEDIRKTPLVRYSSLPSRKTLKVLWGAIEKVGSRKLYNITKDHVADDSFADFDNLDKADVFISHSHHDYIAVMDVAKHLLQNEIMPWLAETHIEQGKHIHEEIISALGVSQDFLLYLSPNALDSRWTGKEYLYAVKRGIPIFVVADIDFSEIAKLLAVMGNHKQMNGHVAQQFTSFDPDFLRFLIQDNERIVEMFAYSKDLANKLLPENVRPYTELPSSIRARRSSS